MIRMTGPGKTCLANQLYLERMRNTPRSMSDSSLGLSGTYGAGIHTDKINSAQKNSVSSAIQKAAEAVSENCKNLTATGEGSLLEQAISSGNTKDMVKEVNSFVENYNAMVEKLKKSNDTMDKIYSVQLKADGEKYKDQLAAIGIGMGEDGTMSVDQKKLESASPEEFKAAFGKTNSFLGDLAVKSIYIEANAALNASQNNSGYYNNYNSLLDYTSGKDSSYEAGSIGSYFNDLR